MNFIKLDTLLDGLYKRYGVPACELIVNRGYERIYHKVCGYSDVRRTVPATENDVYWLYSETKLYTAVAVMQLYERLKLDLDEPVYKWLPEFEGMTVKTGRKILPARNAITVRRLLSMAVGFGYNIDSPHLRRLAGMNVSTREAVKALAEQPMQFEPGTHFLYNLCHDVLAPIVEEVSDMSYGDYLRRNIYNPLGITELEFSAEKLEAKGHVLSAQYRYDEKTGIIKPVPKEENRYKLGKNYQSGGAGLCGTARDYIKLPQALANGGVTVSGDRLLRSSTLELLRTDHAKGTMRREFNQMKSGDYSYGLGVRVRMTEGRMGEPVGEFGWDGAAGAYNLIDTENKISIHYVQHVLDPYSWCSGLHTELREAVYEGLRS